MSDDLVKRLRAFWMNIGASFAIGLLIVATILLAAAASS